MAALMMSGMCASVQAELDGLFGELDGRGVRTRAVSAQAFSKARRGLSAEVFELARARLIELAQPRIDSMRWNGLRPVAADGSRLRVGTRQGHDLRADHYAFALFLPGPTAPNGRCCSKRSMCCSPAPICCCLIAVISAI
jgi:hypothetical protein